MSNGACSQNLPHKIIGEWSMSLVQEGDGKKYAMECPDVLSFEANGQYQIFNDCYGNDIENPIIERGKWIFDIKENKISLKDRKFSSSYTFHDSTPALTLYVKEITDKSMKLCFNNKDGCITENYEKKTSTNKSQNYTGTGTTTKELSLSGKETAIKLSYEFYKEPDQLIIEDQNGKQLYKTEMIATNEAQKTTVSLNGVVKLVFKIKSEQPNSKWRFKVELQ